MVSETDGSLSPHYYRPEDDIFFNPKVKSITEDYDENFPSIVDRFFTRYYYIRDSDTEFAPYQVLVHTNRICLICLAPEHPALKIGIESLDFDIGGFDRSKNNISGKGKKGGMSLQDSTTLALLKTKDGSVYKIPSCIRSKLIKVNNELSKDPKLLENSEEGEAYVAIVLPKPEQVESLKTGLLSEDEYKKLVMQRSTNTSNVVVVGNEIKDVEV